MSLSGKEMKIFNENGFYTKDVKEFVNNRLLWIDRILKQYSTGEKSRTFHIQIIKDFKAERKRLIEEAGDKLIDGRSKA